MKKIFHELFKNKSMVILPLFFMGLLVSIVISFKTGPEQNNRPTRARSENGWIIMFDGKTIEGWRGYNKETFPATGWIIEDGALACISSRIDRANRGGSIIYDRKFLNFHLKLDWKISEGGNSGIFYLVREIPDSRPWYTGPEYQILDNERHPDALRGVDGNRKSAALYDLLPAIPQNAKPAGEWNTAEIIVKNGHIIHRQNGEDVLEYQLSTSHWEKMLENSKYNVELFGKFLEGYIGLQDHGDDVWYRNIKIKPL